MTDVREALLRKQLARIADEQSYAQPQYNIIPVPVTGSNFTAQLSHVTLSSAGRADLHLFAKVAVIGKELRTTLFKQIFEVEPYVYTKVFPVYKRLEDQHDVPKELRLAVPKCYGYSDVYLEEVMVLEDLSVAGYTTYDRFKSLDWEYAAAAVVQLARLHGLSIAYQRECPEQFEETKQVLRVEDLDATTASMGKVMLVRTAELVRVENRPRVQRLIDQKFDPTSFMRYAEGRRPVIIHNDFKQANLMHKYDERGKLQVVVIDHQTQRLSAAATDLLYFMFNCADGKFRRQHYERLVDLYYEQMAATLQRLHLDPEEVYPRPDFDEELKETMPYSLLHSLLTLPIFYVEQAEVRQFEEGDDLESISRMMSSPSALCAERINELVDDCIRWGVLDDDTSEIKTRHDA